MNADERRAKRAAWQRRWRANSDKIGATIYLTRLEVDVLDWLTEQLMDNDPESTHVVGRIAGIRALIEGVIEEHGDQIRDWSESAEEPSTRAIHFKEELGRRRRGPRYEEFKNLPQDEQQARARSARRRAMAKKREINRHRQESLIQHDQRLDSDPDS